MAPTSALPTADRLQVQLLKNSALMVVARAAGVITLILAVPVIVERLGPEGYGVWESLLAISGMAMVFQSAVSGAVLWRISASFGVQDHAETRRLVRTGIGATLLLLAALVPLVLVGRDRLLVELQVPERFLGDAHWLLPAAVGVMLLGGVNETLAAVLAGYQRAGLASLVQSAGLAATNLTALAILALGGDLPALLIGLLAGFATMFAVLYPLASSLCGRIALRPLWPSRRDLAVAGPFVGLLLLSNLTFVFRDHTDKLVLASGLSPAMTGYFGLAQRLSALVMQVCAVFYTPLTAAIGSLAAREDWEGIRNLYRTIGTWMAALAGLAAVLVCSLREPLFVLWLGQTHREAHQFLPPLLLGATSAVIFTGAGVSLAKGLGRPGLETAYTLVTLLLIVVLKPLLIGVLGPTGTVAASAVSWCLGSICFLLLLHRAIQLPREMIGRTLGIFLVTAGSAGCGWWLAARVAGPPGRGGAGLLLAVAVPLVTAGYLGLLAGLRLIPPEHLRAVGKQLLARLPSRLAAGARVPAAPPGPTGAA